MRAIVFLALRRRRLTRIPRATWLLGLLLLLHIVASPSLSWRHLLLETFALLLLLLSADWHETLLPLAPTIALCGMSIKMISG